MRTLIDTSSYGEYLHYGMPLTLVTVLDSAGRVNVSTNGSITPLPGQTPRLVIGILKENYTNELIAASGEFVINLLTDEMRGVARLCGSHSGHDTDKLALAGLTTQPARFVKPPIVVECPLNIECRVVDVQHLDELDLWTAHIVGIDVAAAWSDGRRGVAVEHFRPLLYAFGQTMARGPIVGRGAI